MSEINCFGYLYGNIGYAVFSRNFFAELSELVDITVYPLSTNKKEFKLEERLQAVVEMPDSVDPTKPAIGILQPAQLAEFPGSPSIGFTIFEGTAFPDPESEGLEAVDRLWVPSRWAKKVLVENGISARKVSVVPGGVDPDVFNSNFEPHPDYYNEDKFTFLSAGKWEKRKGHRELVEVFSRTFEGRRDVELLLCAENMFRPDLEVENLLEKMNLPQYPEIKAVGPLETSAGMASLYRSADIFVLLTRAEGWGLPVIEALACGTPAIATDYGPISDYLSDEYSFPVKPLGFEEINDPASYPLGGEHGRWAVPDLEKVSKIFQAVAGRKNVVKKMGSLAEKTIHNRWSWKHAAQKAVRQLNRQGIL